MKLGRIHVLLLSAPIVVGASMFTWAQLGPGDPRVMAYQGTLELNGAGAVGAHDIRVAAFASATPDATCLVASNPGTCGLWWEEHTNVTVAAGRFSLLLGSRTALPDTFYAQNAAHLAIAVRAAGAPAYTLLDGAQRVVPAPIAGRSMGATNFTMSGTLTVGGGANISGALGVGGDVTIRGGQVTITDGARITGSNGVGNLHLDANSAVGSDGRIYMNFFNGRGVNFGNGGGGVVAAVDASGNINAGNVTVRGNLTVQGNAHENCYDTGFQCGRIYCAGGYYMVGLDIDENEACGGGGDDRDFSSYSLTCCQL